MTSPIFYLSSIAFSGIGFFVLWQFGWKKLLLDNFRDSLFRTRDKLYKLAADGCISCDDPAYRAVEDFINRTIRYAHRFTFLSFAFTAISLKNAQAAGSYDDQHLAMEKTINKLKDVDLKASLNSLINEVWFLLPRYIAKSSLAFIVGSLLYVVFRSVSPLIAILKDKVVRSFEIEASRDAKFETYASA